jgi:hypothetical protein
LPSFGISLLNFLLFSFKNLFYILGNACLANMPFSVSFFQFGPYPLILLTVSFVKEKFIILMKSTLLNLCFIDQSFAVMCKKSSSYPRFSIAFYFYNVFPGCGMMAMMVS